MKLYNRFLTGFTVVMFIYLFLGIISINIFGVIDSRIEKLNKEVYPLNNDVIDYRSGVSRLWIGTYTYANNNSVLGRQLITEGKLLMENNSKELAGKIDNNVTERFNLLKSNAIIASDRIIECIDKSNCSKDEIKADFDSLQQNLETLRLELSEMNLKKMGQMKYELENIISQSRNFSIFLFCSIILTLIAAVIYFFMATIEITKPIEKLIDTAKEASLGNLDIRSEINIKNEIGKFSAIFDNMLYQLKKNHEELSESQKKLKEFNEELEKKVEQRTSELNEYQKALENQTFELQDRTAELQERSAQLEISEAETKKLLDSKSYFINMIAHDLRTPLTPIITLLPLVKEIQTDEVTKKDIEVIEQNINYLNKLLNEMLTIARMDSRRFSADMKKTSVKKIFDWIMDSNKPIYDKYNIHVSCNIKDDLYILAEDVKIVEVINNLIFNAINYINPGEGKIWINAELNGLFVEISVADNGIGVPDNKKAHLFEEFYTVDETRHKHGTGLGLNICKRIIEIHSGKIGIKNNIPNGAIIYFTIPAWDEKSKSINNV